MKSLRSKALVLAVVTVALAIIQLVNSQMDGGLNQYGVIPRSVDHVHQILFAPFVHTGWGHLFNNLLGLAVFGSLCLLRSIRFYAINSLIIIVVGGLLVWLFGRSASHIGASGWVFGLWSLSIAIAWFDRRFGNIVVAMIVIFFYSGLAYGFLPGDPGISFEMHLAGAVAGVLAAFLYSRWLRQ